MENHESAGRLTEGKVGESSGLPRISEASVSTRDIALNSKNDREERERDIEKGNPTTKLAERSSEDLTNKVLSTENEEELEDEPGVIKRYWRGYRPLGHAIIWLLVTAYDSLPCENLSIDGGSVAWSYIVTSGLFPSSFTSPSRFGSSSAISLCDA
jgi:hypothetical protein